MLAVVLEPSGKSKGYGFVRFSEETDQQRALIEMQHMQGVGKKPIRVSLATPKRYLSSTIFITFHCKKHDNFFDFSFESDYR